MAVHVHWALEHHITYGAFAGIVQTQDVIDHIQQVAALVEQGRAQHSIVDMTGIERIQVNPQRVLEAVKRTRGAQLVGWTVFVGQLNPAARFVVSAVGQIVPFRFMVMSSREEALAFLEKRTQVA